MLKCNKCGIEIRDGQKFCGNCGNNISKQKEQIVVNENSNERCIKKCSKCESDFEEEANFCAKCGGEIEEGIRFCPNYGNGILEEKKKTENMFDETKEMEDNQKNFYFEKVKMIGTICYKTIRTEVINSGNSLEIKQNIHKLFRRKKEKNLQIKLSEIHAAELKTKMDFWDTLYAIIFGIFFLLDITDIIWLFFIGVCLYTGYGKIIDLKMKNGLNFEIPVNGKTEDVEGLHKLIESFR